MILGEVDSWVETWTLLQWMKSRLESGDDGRDLIWLAFGGSRRCLLVVQFAGGGSWKPAID